LEGPADAIGGETVGSGNFGRLLPAAGDFIRSIGSSSSLVMISITSFGMGAIFLLGAGLAVGFLVLDLLEEEPV